jgi:hypothetical protein
MSIHRYSLQNLLPDYLRGGAGLVIGAGGWLLAPGVLQVIIIFGGLTVLFLLFTMRTVARQYTRIEMTDDAIISGGTRRLTLHWSDLDHVKLRYYSTRRNRSGGWMTLKLASGRTAISVDSNIDGFDAIAAQAARSMVENRAAADDITLANLAALGLTTPPQAMPAGPAEASR